MRVRLGLRGGVCVWVRVGLRLGLGLRVRLHADVEERIAAAITAGRAGGAPFLSRVPVPVPVPVPVRARARVRVGGVLFAVADDE